MNDINKIEYGSAFGLMNQWMRISKIHSAVMSGDSLAVRQLIDVEMKMMILSIMKIWGECSNLDDLKDLIKLFDKDIWKEYKSNCNDSELVDQFEQFIVVHGIR